MSRGNLKLSEFFSRELDDADSRVIRWRSILVGCRPNEAFESQFRRLALITAMTSDTITCSLFRFGVTPTTWTPPLFRENQIFKSAGHMTHGPE